MVSIAGRSIQDNFNKRNSALDVYRGIAVILVMFNHIHVIADADATNPAMQVIRDVFEVLYTGGWVGVDLFFVLSGFLVSGLLFKEYGYSFKVNAPKFLIRRGFKLYPSFIVFLLFTFILERAYFFYTKQPDFPYLQYLWDLIFMHNYLGGRWSHTWTLAVEEHFYILLTIFFLICIKYQKLNLNTLYYTYIFLVVFCIASRLYLNIVHPEYDFDLHYTLTHTRISALFYGVVLSYYYMFRQEALLHFLYKYKVPLLLLSSFLLTNFFFERDDNNWISVFSLTVNAICFGILIVFSLRSQARLFQNKTLAFIGRHSYNIYLWHFFTNIISYQLFKNYMHNQYIWLGYIVFFFVSTFFVGVFFTKVVEEPLLKIRDRLYPTVRTASQPKTDPPAP